MLINTFRKLLLILLGFTIIIPFLAGQDRTDLEAQRKELLAEIEETSRLLAATQKDKAATLDRYFALQTQIRKRQQLINTLKKEIEFSNASIDRANEVIAALNEDEIKLKEEYANMVREAYRLRLNKSMLLFLFSANNYNDLFNRWQYIRQYDDYRKRQANLILNTQEMLSSKAQQLELDKVEKEKLLASENRQKQLLNKELTDKNTIIEDLKGNENRLTSELSKQQKAHQELNNTIETIIKNEMAIKRKAARDESALSATPEDKPTAPKLSGDFQNNKGKMAWPVRQGVISRHFGTQPHPTIKTIEISNNGIDIRTGPDAQVYAVFKGRVVGIQFIPGYKNMVILQHGQYYTVYSNLEELLVKKGDNVSTRQMIGRLSSDKPEVHFEVWREKQRLNPINWVSRG